MISSRSTLPGAAVLAALALAGCASTATPATREEPAAQEPAAAPTAFDAYMEFRRWINAQPDELRARDEAAVLAAYSEHLARQGLAPDAVAARMDLLRKGADDQEVELWNRVLTSDTPRFNTDPNAFLVRMIQGREPGRALDVGMGQGRNAIWLASQGWDVTGFDPADRAVALANELAAKAGVHIETQVVGSEDFDWGTDRWDLIVLSYVSVRENLEQIERSLAPGGLVVLEAFHEDATKNASIGRSVVWHTNELLQLFSDLRILHYEDTVDVADFGRSETPIVRLLARKE